MKYTEQPEAAEAYREEYQRGIEELIRRRREEADAQREERMRQVCADPERARKEWIGMLGWPLTEPEADALPRVKQSLVCEEDGRKVFRMQFEVLPDLWCYGVLILQQDREAAPFVIAQHGALGTPEMCCGLYDSTHNYNEMAERVLAQSETVNLFAPQLLIWNSENRPVFDRQLIDAKLKQVGSSITAVELYELRRIVDWFSAQPYVDPERIGMIGLSYGGFYTLFAAAADPRIKAAVSCSFFNDRFEYPLSDWVWDRSGFTFTDAEVAALVCPRYLHVLVGRKDDLFDVAGAKRVEPFVREAFRRGGREDRFRFTVFEGTHELFREEEPIREFLAQL